MQGRQFLLLLNPKKRVAGVGCQEPRHVFRVGERCVVETGAADEFDKLVALELRGSARVGCHTAPKILLAFGQRNRLHRLRRAAWAAHNDHKIAQIGCDNDAVPGQIVFHLSAEGNGFDIGLCSLGFNRSARWQLPGLGLAVSLALKLIDGEQSAVRDASALVAQVDDAADLGFERSADRVEET
ncbi:MAG: hypothetical protein ABSB42_19570 [Tepidisphaeraceae bacterium]